MDSKTMMYQAVTGLHIPRQEFILASRQSYKCHLACPYCLSSWSSHLGTTDQAQLHLIPVSRKKDTTDEIQKISNIKE